MADQKYFAKTFSAAISSSRRDDVTLLVWLLYFLNPFEPILTFSIISQIPQNTLEPTWKTEKWKGPLFASVCSWLIWAYDPRIIWDLYSTTWAT